MPASNAAPRPTSRPLWAPALLAVVGITLASAASAPPSTHRAVPPSPALADDFPTVWGLSKRSYRAAARMHVVSERFVVAFADGTYSTDMAALFGSPDAPGTGERLGEWKIEDGRLLTRFDDPDGEFRPQYFERFRTRPAPAGLRLSGCYSGRAIRLAFRFRTLCFSPDGTYQRADGDLAADTRRTSDGTYTIDGHRLVLQEPGQGPARTGFAVLAGDAAAPTSIAVGRERFTARGD